jgi:predicted metal-dependent hydrolase
LFSFIRRALSMSAQLQLFESHESSQRWTVRVSRRARRLSVRVYPGGRVEVVVPPGASAATVQRFVGSHRQWIDRRVEDLSAAEGVIAERRPDCLSLPAIGRQVPVEYLQDDRPSIRLQTLPSGGLLVRGRVNDEDAVIDALRRWLADVALEALGNQLHGVARESGFAYRRVQIRRQRTRWGSCSVSGTISLNVCLLFLEPAVVRYLLVHELCHTRHMNHSNRFWSLVEAHVPDYRSLDRELLRGWQRVPGWMFS